MPTSDNICKWREILMHVDVIHTCMFILSLMIHICVPTHVTRDNLQHGTLMIPPNQSWAHTGVNVVKKDQHFMITETTCWVLDRYQFTMPIGSLESFGCEFALAFTLMSGVRPFIRLGQPMMPCSYTYKDSLTIKTPKGHSRGLCHCILIHG